MIEEELSEFRDVLGNLSMSTFTICFRTAKDMVLWRSGMK